ncbi:MAG: LamG-like jellyroll fold domain-containing protein [Polyangiales bacterium]
MPIHPTAEPRPPLQGVCLTLSASAYVQCGNGADLCFDQNKPFTVGGWVKPAAFDTASVLLCRQTQYQLGLNAEGKPTARRDGMASALVGAHALPVDQWSHVAMTYDGTTLSLYVNAISVGSVASSTSAGSFTDTQVTIGCDGASTPGHFFDGQISEFEVFNYARQEDSLEDTLYIRAPQQHGLVAYFRFSAIPASDISGHANPITFVGAPNYALVAHALAFPAGLTAGYAACTVNTGVTPTPPTNAYTLSAWVYPSVLPAPPHAPAAFATIKDSAHSLQLCIGDGTLQVVGDEVVYVSSSSLSAEQWTFVTVTVDSTASELKIYLNGTLDKTLSLAGALPFPAGSGHSIQVGQHASTTPFQGYIQSLRIFTDVRTATEITSWMHLMPIFQQGIYASFACAFDPPCDQIGIYDVALQGGLSLGAQTSQVPTSTQDWEQLGLTCDLLPALTDAAALDRPLDIAALRDDYSPVHAPALHGNIDDHLRAIRNEALALCAGSALKGYPAAQQALGDTLDKHIAHATRDLKAPPEVAGHRFVIEEVEGEARLVHHFPGGRETLITGAKTQMDRELLWEIQFFSTLIIGIFSIFLSVQPNTGRRTARVITRMVVDPELKTALKLVMKAPSATSLFSLLTDMFSGGWLKQIALVILDGITFWAGLRIAAKFAAGAAVGWITYTAAIVPLIAQLAVLAANKPKKKKNKLILSMYQVNQADCFSLQTIETEDEKPAEVHTVLVDAGRSSGWDAIKSVVPDDLDAVCVTHTDADHIDGAVKLLRQDQKTVHTLWFNSPYKHYGVTPPAPTALEDGLTPGDAAGMQAQAPEASELHTPIIESLRAAATLTYLADHHAPPIPIQATAEGDGSRTVGFVNYNLIGPSNANLTNFFGAVRPHLAHPTGASPGAVVVNRASIIMKAYSPIDKVSVLLTGDAVDVAGQRDIQTALGMTGTLAGPSSPQFFTFMKVPHHGSQTTEDANFYQQVLAEYYLISGKSPWPYLNCLKWIVAANVTQPNGVPIKIYLTNQDTSVISALQTAYPPATSGHYSVFVLNGGVMKMNFTVQDGQVTPPAVGTVVTQVI